MPRPSHALVVRDVASKCALVAFSGCASLHPPPSAAEELDGGVADADGTDAGAR